MSLLIHSPTPKGCRGTRLRSAHASPGRLVYGEGEIFVSSGWRMRHSRLSLALPFTGLARIKFESSPLSGRSQLQGSSLKRRFRSLLFPICSAQSNQSAITSKRDGLSLHLTGRLWSQLLRKDDRVCEVRVEMKEIKKYVMDGICWMERKIVVVAVKEEDGNVDRDWAELGKRQAVDQVLFKSYKYSSNQHTKCKYQHEWLKKKRNQSILLQSNYNIVIVISD